MPSIDEVLDSFKQATLPMLNDLKAFLSPFAAVLPDRRYGQSLAQFVPGMLAARSPKYPRLRRMRRSAGRVVGRWPSASTVCWTRRRSVIGLG